MFEFFHLLSSSSFGFASSDDPAVAFQPLHHGGFGTVVESLAYYPHPTLFSY